MRVSLFSLLPGHQVETGQDLYEVGLLRAALADDLGFHCFWIAEHHVRTVSSIPNPAVFLAAASQCTKRIRLGTAVSVLSIRHPLLVAEEYALVDRLSGGRLEFGVGSGASQVELEGLGVDAKSKRARFAETLALVRRAWGRDDGRITGQFHKIGNLRCNVEPLQRPSPPIWIAVNSTDGAGTAGADGNGLLLLLSPDVANLDMVRDWIQAYHSAWAGGGHDPSAARVAAAAFACVADDGNVARDRAAAGFERLATAQGETADGQAVIDSMIERGTALIGTSDLVVEQLDALASAGVTETLTLLDFGGAPEPQIEESMKLIASEVTPRL